MRFNSAKADDCIHYSIRHKGGGFRMSPNFTLAEFDCNDGNDTVIVHPVVIHLVQRLRDHFGSVVRINSAYRTPFHNKNVGGRPSSRHMYGFAVDVDVMGVKPKKVADYAETLKVGGIGRYDTFTHLDVWGRNRRWDYTTGIDTTP